MGDAVIHDPIGETANGWGRARIRQEILDSISQSLVVSPVPLTDKEYEMATRHDVKLKESQDE